MRYYAVRSDLGRSGLDERYHLHADASSDVLSVGNGLNSYCLGKREAKLIEEKP